MEIVCLPRFVVSEEQPLSLLRAGVEIHAARAPALLIKAALKCF